MQSILVFMLTLTPLSYSIVALTPTEEKPLIPHPSAKNADEYDSESARKIIGSRVVTSVSVVMNGKEPQFTDAVGNYIPKPLVPPRVASPVSLLDPDRYEFYTFSDDGELVKRLMTMEEIQSIVANGDSEQQTALAKNPIGNNDDEVNIRNIVNNVQKVLHSEMINNNFTTSLMYNKLDTPDTSSSWSSILPAIFGNTGDSILANKAPITTTSKKPHIKHKTPSTSSILNNTIPPKVNEPSKQKQKPPRLPSVSSSTPTLKPSSPNNSNNKYAPISQTTQNVKKTVPPNKKTSILLQNTISSTTPTKSAISSKPSNSSPGFISTPSEAWSISSITHSNKISQKLTQVPARVTSPSHVLKNSSTPVPSSSRPIHNKHPTKTTIALKTNTTPISSASYATKKPTTLEISPTKKNIISHIGTSQNNYILETLHSTLKDVSTSTQKPKSTKITSNFDEVEKNTRTSTVKDLATTLAITTQRTAISSTHTPLQKINFDSAAIMEPEPDNIFDSELSLNQIIESLKDLEGTTLNSASNIFDSMDMTTFGYESKEDLSQSETETMIPTDINANESAHPGENSGNLKDSIIHTVSYIPQTTIDDSDIILTTENYDHKASLSPIGNNLHKSQLMGTIEHKGNDNDDMILNENSTTEPEFSTTNDKNLSKQPNSMENLLRESFDSVLSQVQSEGFSTTIEYDIGTTSIPKKQFDKKKAVLKPTPYIPIDGVDGLVTEPMHYFEAVIKQYEQDKMVNSTVDSDELTGVTTEVTTEKLDGGFVTETTQMFSTIDYSSNEPPSTNAFEDNKSDASEESTNKYDGLTSQFDKNSPSKSPLRVDETTEVSSFESTSALMNTETERDGTTSAIEITDYDTSTQVDTDTSTTESYLAMSTGSENLDTTTDDGNGFQYEIVELIENIMKNSTEIKTDVGKENGTIPVERKEDHLGSRNMTSGAGESYEDPKRDEMGFSDLGETTSSSSSSSVAASDHDEFMKAVVNIPDPTKPPVAKLKVPTLAPILNNLKMKVVNALKNTNIINLEPAPKQALGLEESTTHIGEDVLEFAKFCNEVAFNFWVALNNDGISSARSLTLSPFALTSMLGALFLGARGRTSGEINDLLHLDDIVTFNPHAILRNISESIEGKEDGQIYGNVFVRELLSDRSKGKILPFFKEKVNQFYSGYVEEVNFNTINDIIRRRTNLLMKRYSGNRMNDYLKAGNVWVKPPLAGISANLFETDCSKASKSERDGEMFFQVLPAIRQRRLIPIPAVVFRSGFLAGFDPELDATAVAIGLSEDVVSTIFVMPGQQGHSAPGDNLERLESVLMANAVSQNAWRRLLTTLMVRPSLEVQIPRFTHRSFVNTTNALRKLGLETLFDQNLADLRGITGSIGRDMYVSDLIQINTFSTCGEDKLAEEHHTEMYPAPQNKHRNMGHRKFTSPSLYEPEPVAADYENERAFASDPIYDSRYLDLPLPLRPRQARVPETPRLRFDKPFIYFVRHNPTGMVLYFGRFNPRLLP